MAEFEYDGKIINDDNAKIAEVTELTSEQLKKYNPKEAIERLAKRELHYKIQRNGREDTESFFDIVERLNEKYKAEIEALGKVQYGVKEYEELSKAGTEIEGLRYELGKAGIDEERGIKKILDGLKMKNYKSKQEVKENIKENAEKTQGLPTTTGLKKSTRINEKLGSMESYYLEFVLDEAREEPLDNRRYYCSRK